MRPSKGALSFFSCLVLFAFSNGVLGRVTLVGGLGNVSVPSFAFFQASSSPSALFNATGTALLVKFDSSISCNISANASSATDVIYVARWKDAAHCGLETISQLWDKLPSTPYPKVLLLVLNKKHYPGKEVNPLLEPFPSYSPKGLETPPPPDVHIAIVGNLSKIQHMRIL